jgi:hypothetical protein
MRLPQRVRQARQGSRTRRATLCTRVGGDLRSRLRGPTPSACAPGLTSARPAYGYDGSIERSPSPLPVAPASLRTAGGPSDTAATRGARPRRRHLRERPGLHSCATHLQGRCSRFLHFTCASDRSPKGRDKRSAGSIADESAVAERCADTHAPALSVTALLLRSLLGGAVRRILCSALHFSPLEGGGLALQRLIGGCPPKLDASCFCGWWPALF